MITDRLRILDFRRIFRDRTDNVNDIDLLIAKLAQSEFRISAEHGFGLYLSGNHDHGNGIQPCSRHTGNGARPAGNTDDRRNSGSPGIGFRRDRACLFMQIAEPLNPRFTTESIVQVHCAAACHQKCLPEPPVGKRPENIITDSHRPVLSQKSRITRII